MTLGDVDSLGDPAALPGRQARVQGGDARGRGIRHGSARPHVSQCRTRPPWSRTRRGVVTDRAHADSVGTQAVRRSGTPSAVVSRARPPACGTAGPARPPGRRSCPLDRRRLDHRAARRHQPVEALGRAESGDRSGAQGRRPRSAGIVSRCGRTAVGIAVRRERPQRRLVELDAAARKRCGRQWTTIPALKPRRAPRAARPARSRTRTAYARGVTPRATIGLLDEWPRRFEAAQQVVDVAPARWRRPVAVVAGSPSHASGHERPRCRSSSRLVERGASRASASAIERGERQQHVVGDLGERPSGVARPGRASVWWT